MATAVGLSKVFILDKYFTELQKFWETEKKLKDASSSKEAVHLQQRLKSLSSELVTLRTRLQPNSSPGAGSAASPGPGSGPHGQDPNYNKPLSRLSEEVTDARFHQQVKRMEDHLDTKIDDLIHLHGPLTEDSVLRTLRKRFQKREYFTNVGPVLLSLNSYDNVGNPLTLNSMHQTHTEGSLIHVVHEAVRQQSETGYPQAIILSGESGSGKTFCSMLLLRQLFELAGGGKNTDSYKHLAASFTVLRSLGSAKTSTNAESSRIGNFIEVQVTGGALYRTKIHSYFLDQTRVVKQLPKDKNYHIFYQMLAGLTKEEREKLNLDGYTVNNLRYLNRGDTKQNEYEESERFEAWKACLSVLGIPFMDVVRVLSAVLLLGNIQFKENSSNGTCISSETGISSFDPKTNNEMRAVASLLGISSASMYRGLTTRTHNVRGQLVKSVCDGTTASATRDALAKALYCRTVATIVRRANSLKRISSNCGTMSSDSNESVHHIEIQSSHHASTIGSSGTHKSHKSLNVLNSAVRHVTDGFIGILDMFGFEDSRPSKLEQLCINLCAETMQHFYNTHIFKSSMESCREEGVQCDINVDYVDNVPCIDFISSLKTGLLSLLDTDCSLRNSPEAYVQNIKSQHKGNSRFVEIGDNFKQFRLAADIMENNNSGDHRLTRFGIRHFAGNVMYDAFNFLDANRDVVPDDAVAVFHKSSCSFGFASHLFGMELKALFSRDVSPRGILFRISPTSHTDIQNGNEPISTLTQDFHTRLDNLLQVLVHAKPHFIRCIKSNNDETRGYFDRGVVVDQLRALQVLETVNLMAGGLPHRMRFRAFNSRYRCLAPFHKIKRDEDKAVDDCKIILVCFVEAIQEIGSMSPACSSWALGKRHIFLSEGVRQELETLRKNKRDLAAVTTQALWRGWHLRKKWPMIKTNLFAQKQARVIGPKISDALLGNVLMNGSGPLLNLGTLNRPRPQPITGTPPPETCDSKIIQQTCNLFGLDTDNPPPVPPSRHYTVAGNARLGYPQTRIMKMDYPEDGSGEVQMLKGETVLVVGASPKRGHLLVEHENVQIHVPYQYMQLKPTISPLTQANSTNSVAALSI